VKYGFGEETKTVEMAKLPRLKDRKIKTPTAVALIVVVGVEVKGASAWSARSGAEARSSAGTTTHVPAQSSTI
jgi:hypothetical protein